MKKFNRWFWNEGADWLILAILCLSILGMAVGCKNKLPTSPDIDPIIDPPAQLVVSCSASVTEGEAPLTVEFAGTVSGGVAPYSYSWDFGDGEMSDLWDPTYTYTKVGDYIVTFTVTDNQQNQADDTVNISVLIRQYEINFKINISSQDNYLDAIFELYIGDYSQFDLIDTIEYPTSTHLEYRWTQELSAGAWQVILRLANGNERTFQCLWTFTLVLETFEENVRIEPVHQTHPWVYMSCIGRTMSLGFTITEK